MTRERDVRDAPRGPYGGSVPAGGGYTRARRPGVFRDRRPRYLPRDERGRRRGMGGGLLLGLLLLIGLGLLLWFFLSRSDDGATGGDTTVDGTIATADGTDLLAASGDAAALAPYEGQSVTARGVPVLAVVGDGFWAGTDEANRLFVRTDGTTESAVTVIPGDRVSFTGTLEVLPIDYDTRFGLGPDDGGDQLAGQGHYISATDVSVAD